MILYVYRHILHTYIYIYVYECVHSPEIRSPVCAADGLCAETPSRAKRKHLSLNATHVEIKTYGWLLIDMS